MVESRKTIEHKIADWSTKPGPRYREQGPKSGEEFYCDILRNWYNEAVAQGTTLTVILDGTEGYLTSFIDEAFGRLAYEFGAENVRNLLIIESKLEPEWEKRIYGKTFSAWEERRREGKAPRTTKSID